VYLELNVPARTNPIESARQSYDVYRLRRYNPADMCPLSLLQRLSDGQNYAIVCPNLTYLWHNSRTAL